MLSSTNTPIFVDFGFAQKWDVYAVDKGANSLIGGLTTLTGHNASCHELFQSEISWGTPEYLDPQRAKGLRHDERASDVWALGVSTLNLPESQLDVGFMISQVTFFEILIGRTPFEESDDEQFSTTEQLGVYYDRTVKGEWLGDWSMSSGQCEGWNSCARNSLPLGATAMRNLLKRMICPNPVDRINACDANRHEALDEELQVDLSTPPFVRTAASLPIETRAKKQIPREKREQKRSQALQAETGAKFVADNHVVGPLPDRKRDKTETTSAPELKTELHASVAVAASEQTKVTENQPQQNEETERDSRIVNASPALAETSPTIVARHAPLEKTSEPPISLANAEIQEHQSVGDTGKP